MKYKPSRGAIPQNNYISGYRSLPNSCAQATREINYSRVTIDWRAFGWINYTFVPWMLLLHVCTIAQKIYPLTGNDEIFRRVKLVLLYVVVANVYNLSQRRAS